MEIADLNQKERLALVALVQAVVQADRQASEEEQAMLAGLIEDLGEDWYQKAVETTDAQLETEDQLKEYAATIERQEARELIYGTLLELSMADVVSGRESALLDWLATTWQVEATFDEGAGTGEMKA